MDFVGSHILSIDQFSLEDVESIFRVALAMEPYARRRRRTRVLQGAVLGNLFFEASTRSRFSFASAFERLGGSVREMTGFEFSSFAKGESISDTSRVMSGYVDVIVVRHPEEGKVHDFAAATHIPVINSGDGPGEHPTQALLDLYTIQKEIGKPIRNLAGLRIAMVGDLWHGRTVHSLVRLMSLLENISFAFVAPEGLQMPKGLVELARSRGHQVELHERLEDGLADSDIVYVTRLQKERFASNAEVEKYRGLYSIDRYIFQARCKPNTVLLHPLPRDSSGPTSEISSDLDGHPSLAIFRQADNGVPVRMALFVMVLDVLDRVEDSAEDVGWYVPERLSMKDTF